MPKPRCLVLMPRTPWPQDDGGRVVLWQDLLALAEGFEVRLAVLHPEGQPHPEVPAELVQRGIPVDFVPHRFPHPVPALLRGVWGRWPYTLARFHSRVAERALRQLRDAFRPDLVYLNNLHLATYAPVFEGAVRVLRQQNLEQLFLARYVLAAPNPAVALYARYQAFRMRGIEAELCRKMDLVLAMHEQEAEAMRAFAPAVRVESIPVSAHFPGSPSRDPAPEPTLLIIGSFDRSPNAEGALRFLREGWPVVKRERPDARLRLVGRLIPPSLEQAARETGAEPVGFVPDLQAEFERAWGIVVPLWCGAGIRVKIVEAVAAGLPVVSTPLGAEGIGLRTGEDHLEAEEGRDLGAAALALVREPQAAAERAARARAVLHASYATEAVAARTRELCLAALERRSQVRSPGAARARTGMVRHAGLRARNLLERLGVHDSFQLLRQHVDPSASRMRFPSYDERIQRHIERTGDPTRYSSLALAIQSLQREGIAGDFAEVGVYRGATSRFLMACAPERTLHLFDTFSGFAAQDCEAENQGDERFRDTSMELVRRRLGASERVHIHAGYFPETTAGLESARFAFVLLDLDVHAPTLAGLEFFYPRLVPGGYCFVHDVNNPESNWACRRALEEFLRDKPERAVEFPDKWGSAAFRKVGG